MDELNNKINNLVKLAGNYKLESFILLKDSEGWSDGFMAELVSFNTEKMKAKATLKAYKLTHYKVEGDLPEIKKVIPNESVEVIDIELDLTDGMARLIGKDLEVKVNPIYIKHFVKSFEHLGEVIFILTKKDTPVKVYLNTNGKNILAGIIMPVKS